MALAAVLYLTPATEETAAVPVGETVVVELRDISTTGYRWQLEGLNPSIVTLQKDDVRPSAAPGASGVRRFEFLTTGTGHAALRFELRRPWETNQPPIEQSTVNLTVK
jgi:predicted secreted protein